MLYIRNFCTLAFLLLVQGSSGFEPKCSSFDYDKQLLERMIEREFEFRAVRDEIKHTSVNVKQGLDDVKEDIKLVKQQFIEFKETQENKLTTSLEEFKNDGNTRQLELAEFKKETTKEFEAKSAKLDQVFEQQQAVITRMSSDLHEMENKTLQEIKEFKETQENKLTASLAELKSDGNKRQLDFAEFKKETTKEFEAKSAKLDQVFEQQQAVITRMSSDLHEMVNKTLKEIKAAAKPSVAFRTSASSAFPLPTDKPIIFQSVDFNIGNAYDGNTGVFTAPIDGTYLFTVHMCMYVRNSVNIHIVVDNVPVTRSFIEGDSSIRQCLTETDVLNLTVGARVWIIRYSGWSSAYPFMHDSYGRAYFTGLLV